jgi:hypothetical protein
MRQGATRGCRVCLLLRARCAGCIAPACSPCGVVVSNLLMQRPTLCARG